MNDTFIKTLEIAGIGIAGIFVFMLLFYLTIQLLYRLFPYKKEKSEKSV
jgi:hypothetical protein